VLLSLHSMLAIAAPASSECAAAPAAGKYSVWRADAAQALISRADAPSLATAAALCFVGSTPRARSDPAASKAAAVDLAARASELDPQNPSIAWLRLQLCAGTPGCDIRDAATTLRWVDADNGAVWLPTLAAAERSGDPTEIDRILQDMAQGSRFDFYRNPTIVLLFDTLKLARADLPSRYVPSDLSRLSEAMVLAGAEIVSPLSAVANACREGSDAQRRDSCLKLSRIMQRADTVAAQMAGLHIEKRLAPPDGREARAIADRRRVLEWRVSAASQYDAPDLPWLKNALARERIAQMRRTPREEDIDIAILRKRRIPLEPPDGGR